MIKRSSAPEEDDAPAPKRTSPIPLLIVPHDDPHVLALAQRVQSAEQELDRAHEELDSLRLQRTMLAITTLGGPLLVWLALRNRKAPPAPPAPTVSP